MIAISHTFQYKIGLEIFKIWREQEHCYSHILKLLWPLQDIQIDEFYKPE